MKGTVTESDKGRQGEREGERQREDIQITVTENIPFLMLRKEILSYFAFPSLFSIAIISNEHY